VFSKFLRTSIKPASNASFFNLDACPIEISKYLLNPVVAIGKKSGAVHRGCLAFSNLEADSLYLLHRVLLYK